MRLLHQRFNDPGECPFIVELKPEGIDRRAHQGSALPRDESGGRCVAAGLGFAGDSAAAAVRAAWFARAAESVRMQGGRAAKSCSSSWDSVRRSATRRD